MTEQNRQPVGRGRQRRILGCLGTFADFPPRPVLVKASLGTKLGPSFAQPGSAQAATNCGLLCSSKQVAPGQSQAESYIGLNQSLSHKA